ncbi:WXG100 family type VII secretion target [Mycobacterium sp. D16R24]|uniref:WXG100 family type VII secretion target n=1 Tax=Mycobacterium sp. D16R24 TaxID=1855656 RepID=UPI0011163054|nr:WXG100 family type VII secretion target [Mycobacterium sp. D16R24]
MALISMDHEAMDGHARGTDAIGAAIEEHMNAIVKLVGSLDGTFESRDAAPKFREIQAQTNQMQISIRETVGNHAQVTRGGNQGMQDADAVSGSGFTGI